MKKSELMESLTDKSVEDLQTELHKRLKDQLSHRMQIAVGEFKQTHLLRQNRRTIARIKTLMNQQSKKQ